jgi:hypothetical protein
MAEPGWDIEGLLPPALFRPESVGTRDELRKSETHPMHRVNRATHSLRLSLEGAAHPRVVQLVQQARV